MTANQSTISLSPRNKNSTQKASSYQGKPGVPSSHTGAVYNGFPQRCSSFISTFKQNQRISFTREWFYEEVAVVPLIDWGLNHNSTHRRCVLLPLTNTRDECLVCKNVTRYRDRISATSPSRLLPRVETLRTRPQSSVEIPTNGNDKPSLKTSDYLSQYICISGTSNRESKNERDGEQIIGTDEGVGYSKDLNSVGEGVGYSKDLNSVEDLSDIAQSSEVMAQRLEYMKKTNQVLKYYIDMEEERLKMCSDNEKFSLQNIYIPTSTSQRPHSNIIK